MTSTLTQSQINSGGDTHQTHVTLNNVGKTFGEREVLSAINLELTPGSFHVFTGPSGCGKTTLLRILGGLDSPTTGEVYLGPRLAKSHGSDTPIHTDAQELGYAFQEPRLLPWLDVSSNIALPLTLRGASSHLIAERVSETLEQMRLSDAAHLHPHQLSGGMKMRVAIGRALVSRPQILLLDEPFGALDELTKSRLDDELYQLWRKLKMTVVLVTHSLSEAIYLGERVHVLRPRPAQPAQPLDSTWSSLEGSMQVALGARSPELRLTHPFTEALAELHALLARAEMDML